MPYSSSSSVDINAPRSAVWAAVTEPAEIKEWFFGTNLVTDWKPGSPIFFRGEWEGKEYEDKGEVLEYNPEESLSYTYWSSMGGTEDLPENYQTLRYTLTEGEGQTHLTIDQTDVASQEAADHSAENWKSVLVALKEYVEKKG
jgi:uncharacterized protein YndB with AHSA1/START domain